MGTRGLHARALAGGEHHDVKVRHGFSSDDATGSRLTGTTSEPRTSGPSELGYYRADLERSGRRRGSRRDAADIGGASSAGSKRLVVAQRFEVGIAAGEGPVFGIEGDGALEVRDRFGVFASLGVGHGEHVERVIVVGVLVAHEAQVRDRLVVPTAVDRKSRGVQPFFDRLGPRFAGRRLALADVEVEPHPLVQLLLFRILRSTDSSRSIAVA